jgi:hypothetical protein
MIFSIFNLLFSSEDFANLSHNVYFIASFFKLNLHSKQCSRIIAYCLVIYTLSAHHSDF